MDGVKVLFSQEITAPSEFNWVAMVICLGIFLAFGIILGIFAHYCEEDFLPFMWMFPCVFFGALLGFLFGILVPREDTAVKLHKQKVIIDETVSMKEFNERYEIVGQEGNIYTVYDKKELENVADFYKLEP